MIVVDASALVDVLVEIPVNTDLLRRLEDAELHAPHLIDLELSSVLRRLVHAGSLAPEIAGVLHRRLDDVSLLRYAHAPLRRRVWELKDTLTPYDAVYVALAEVLAIPLVTCDLRMARAPGHRATIESFARPHG